MGVAVGRQSRAAKKKIHVTPFSGTWREEREFCCDTSRCAGRIG
jgi:hypothetical protein